MQLMFIEFFSKYSGNTAYMPALGKYGSKLTLTERFIGKVVILWTHYVMLNGLNYTVLKELDNSHDVNKYCLETPATSPGSGIEAKAVFWPNKDLQQ